MSRDIRYVVGWFPVGNVLQWCCKLANSIPLSGTSSDVENRTVNIDSFLFPLIEDLKRLAIPGIPAHRWIGDELVGFQLRGHLVLLNGDMPAISKVSRSTSIARLD